MIHCLLHWMVDGPVFPGCQDLVSFFWQHHGNYRRVLCSKHGSGMCKEFVYLLTIIPKTFIFSFSWIWLNNFPSIIILYCSWIRFLSLVFPLSFLSFPMGCITIFSAWTPKGWNHTPTNAGPDGPLGNVWSRAQGGTFGQEFNNILKRSGRKNDSFVTAI